MDILIIEDDKSISDLLEIHLDLNGYKVFKAYNGLEGCSLIEERCFDLIILDLMMPLMDGFEVLERIQNKAIPVIVLSARDQLEDKLKGFKLGVDDYMTKPFEALELMMRIKAVLNRTHKKITSFEYGNIRLEPETRLVYKYDKEIELTHKEYELLAYFMAHQGTSLSRDRLLENVWDYAYAGNSRTVDIHVQKLRQKLDIAIKTVYKYGYRLEAL